MKKISIKLTNNDQNLSFALSGRGNLLGYDDDVTAAITDETDSSINNEIDGEVRRIQPDSSRLIDFRFWNGSFFVSNVAPLEFTGSSDFNTTAAKNSFYIIQMYDTFKDEIQSKKHTGYLNGFDFAESNLNSIYTFSPDIEFSNLYITQSLLDKMSGLTTAFYVKFLFYCAKSGTFYSFYNNNTVFLTQEKLYYKIFIDPNMLRYSFADVGTLVLNELINPNYKTLINNTVKSIPVEKSNYPTGNTFTNTGNYVSF